MLDVSLLRAIACLVHEFQNLLSSVQSSACMHRLDLGLYSGMVSEGVFTLRKRCPQPDGSDGGQICNAASHRMASCTQCQLSYSSPIAFPLTAAAAATDIKENNADCIELLAYNILSGLFC